MYTEKHSAGTKVVQSPSNSGQEQLLKVTDLYCIGSQFVIELYVSVIRESLYLAKKVISTFEK